MGVGRFYHTSITGKIYYYIALRKKSETNFVGQPFNPKCLTTSAAVVSILLMHDTSEFPKIQTFRRPMIKKSILRVKMSHN